MTGTSTGGDLRAPALGSAARRPPDTGRGRRATGWRGGRLRRAARYHGDLRARDRGVQDRGHRRRSRWTCSGVEGPFFGPLYREMFRESGAAVRLPLAHTPGIEAEFVVGIATPTCRPASRLGPSGRYASRGGLGGTRSRDRGHPDRGRARGGRGARHRGRRRQHRLRPRADGRRLAVRRTSPRTRWRSASTGSSRQPETAECSCLATRSRALPGSSTGRRSPRAGFWTGDVVTTGTCTGITPLAPGDEVAADYGALGTVTARFTA